MVRLSANLYGGQPPLKNKKSAKQKVTKKILKQNTPKKPTS